MALVSTLPLNYSPNKAIIQFDISLLMATVIGSRVIDICFVETKTVPNPHRVVAVSNIYFILYNEYFSQALRVPGAPVPRGRGAV